MSEIAQHAKRFLVVLMVFLLGQLPVSAQEESVDVVQRSLLHLELSGTPQSGANTSVAGGVKSQGTGFFVSNDGFILTTQHVFRPLEKVKAVNIEIHARVADPGATPLKVQFVSELPSLDLVLLKVSLPFGTQSSGLDLGSSTLVDDSFKREEKLLTAGFQGDDFEHDLALLNEKSSSDVPYAWTIKTKTVSGQSGSPVFIETDSGVVVVGIVKATTRQDDELTLMTPIEFSMPLIGHLKFQELSDNMDTLSAKLDLLIKIIGEINENDDPINTRVQDIEGHVAEIGSHFTWRAVSQADGSVAISYEKIISGGAQVDQILVNMTPFMRVFDEADASKIIIDQIQELRMPNSGQIDRSTLDVETGSGEFVVPDVARSLAKHVDLAARAVGYPVPFRDVEISLIPVVDGQRLALRKLKIVPDFNWDQFQKIEDTDLALASE